jgi:hypothetical protein
LTERAAGPFADHDVDLEVFQRRVEDFLDHRRQAVDLVDEQHVVRLEVGQQRGQVAGALEHRAGGLAQVDAHLGGDDVGQRGLAQPRRAEQQHVVERLAALARGLDEDLELLADLLPGRRSRPGAWGAARARSRLPGSPNRPYSTMKIAQPVCPSLYSQAAAPPQISGGPIGTIDRKKVAKPSSTAAGTPAIRKPIIATVPAPRPCRRCRA